MGRVKTRLAREVGPVAAARFYRGNIAAVTARLSLDSRWRTVLAVTPDRAAGSRCLPAVLLRIAQGGGDLGARMQRIMDRMPPGPTIIVGTDIPGIRPAHIADAFRVLARRRAVLGPTQDGGFWLVGSSRIPRVLRFFANVRWSSPHAFTDTRSNIGDRECALAAHLADVDGAGDMAAARAMLGRRILPAES